MLRLMAILVLLVGCESPIKRAIRDTKYSAYELVGIEKRDLLKRRINDAKTEQKEAGESFTDALDKLQKLYGFKGGELEKRYRALDSSYKTSKEKVGEVKESRAKMETVAQDLFREWSSEISQMHSQDLKAGSEKRLQDTRSRFEQMTAKLKESESRMTPVLSKLNDHVLYLKHNLNAQAVASLKGETARIEGEIQNVLKDMNKAIREADEFIGTIK